ncbi:MULTISPECIES: MAE_28990/MAE_18760 family HEPN-like nuclease [Spirulina sp. CCY15215]|uniref:MAE_28990/MAE_18760 family HEPN-like nuclease n=1 Tax=Spirulina sp. CCY15215 TaxID=2767591 RepID=UPI00194E3596|nr:MAE_28990/MAE_18760 family HEPN-like nuclease [Spirulina major]
MDDFSQAFEDRLQEIETYLDLLEALEKQVRDGVPTFGSEGEKITVKQQRILYSSVYLQLYNLVESTVNQCLNAVSHSVINRSTYPSHLSDSVRREWVRFMARTHTELNHENRLECALELCNYLVQTIPISSFKIEKGAGGGWTDEGIEKMNKRLGFSFNISSDTLQAIKRKFRDDKRPLELIKQFRNKLAHGELSFAECGEGVTVSDLRDLTQRTSLYLREVVVCFKSSIDAHEFLMPEHRPTGVEI